MKLVKHFVCAALLMSVLAVSTPAGEQDTPGYIPPPPPRATIDETTISSSNTTQQDGEITAETSDFLLFEALAALLSVY